MEDVVIKELPNEVQEKYLKTRRQSKKMKFSPVVDRVSHNLFVHDSWALLSISSPIPPSL